MSMNAPNLVLFFVAVLLDVHVEEKRNVGNFLQRVPTICLAKRVAHRTHVLVPDVV